MRIFKDANGLDWQLSITIGSVKRVRDLLKVNLLELDSGEPPLLVRLSTDIVFIVDVIFCLLKPCADERKISDEQFAASIGGSAVLSAQTALYEELTDFFLSSGQSDKAKAMAAQGKIIKAAVTAVALKMDGIDVDRIADKIGQVDINAKIDEILGKPSTGSQG